MEESSSSLSQPPLGSGVRTLMTYFYRRNSRKGLFPHRVRKNEENYFFRRLREAIIPRNAMLDIMLSTLRNEPTDKMLPKDPIDPMEKAEPREPIDINELVDHKLSTELVEPMLLMEFLFAMPSA